MPKTLPALGAILLAAAVATEAEVVSPKSAPTLTGIWTLNQADFERHDKAPYSVEALRIAAKKKADIESGKVIADEERKCLPNGMPTMMLTEFALEVLETPGRVTIVSESSPLVRTIYLNRAKMSDGLEPMWNGYSLGKRQGRVLVVTTSNFNDRGSGIGFGGLVRSSETRLTERFELSPDGKTMIVTTTETDPKLLTAPFTIVRRYTRQPADAELWEYACEVGADGWSERFPGENTKAKAN